MASRRIARYVQDNGVIGYVLVPSYYITSLGDSAGWRASGGLSGPKIGNVRMRYLTLKRGDPPVYRILHVGDTSTFAWPNLGGVYSLASPDGTMHDWTVIGYVGERRIGRANSLHG